MEDPKPLDKVFLGGIIYAGERFDQRAEAVGVRDGRIAAVGSREQVSLLCGPQTAVQDLGERCLLPGFLDPHNHFSITSLGPLMADCRTPPLRTLDEIFEKMQDKAEQTEPGRWVIGYGYEESLLKEGRDPLAVELDRSCPNNPAILMHVSCHRAVVNSLALEMSGYDKGCADPPGGRIERGRSGRPNGILTEQAAMPPFEIARRDRLLLAPGGMEQLFALNTNRLLRLGVVKLADAAVGPRERETYEQAVARGVPVPTDWLEVGEQGMFSLPRNLARNGRIGTSVVKLFLDGAGQCAMEFSLLKGAEGILRVLVKTWRGKLPRSGLRALGKAQTKIARGGTLRVGFFLNDPQQVEAVATEAHREGLPIATHAIGNLAVKRILEIYERLQGRYGPPQKPFRIEHALFLTQDLIDKMARLKVAAVVQPAFLFQYGRVFRSLPIPGSIKVLPLRSMLDAGVLLAGSSDGPCGPEDPMLAMDCAVRRAILDNDLIDPDQALRVEEAIHLYTGGAARVMGCERELGSIEPGKQADLVMLSADPFRKNFVEIRVTETVLQGETAWKRRRLDTPARPREGNNG